MAEENPQRALHYSAGKPGVDQIPPELLLEWGKVFSYGEKKYFRDNWKRGNQWHEFYGSALRHILDFWLGQDYDDCDDSEGCAGAGAEFCTTHSRQHHIAQAIWNLGALRYFQLRHLGEDDRDIVPRGGEL